MDLFAKLLALGGDLATGPEIAGISPQQERAATGRGLTAAGLQTVLASQPGAGPGGANPTAIGAIAQGLLAGQQVGGSTRAGAQQLNQRSQLAQVLAPGTIESMQDGFQYLLSIGDTEGAKLLAEYIDEQQQNTSVTPDRLDLGDRYVFYDPKDPSKITDTILKSPNASEAENKLATDYTRTIGTDIEIARAISRVQASTEAPSAAGDMSLIFAYMKLLDPGSSVREGEQATAAEAGSIPARILGLYNRAVEGTRFEESVRSDFIDRTRRLAKGQRMFLRQQQEVFRRRAESQNADPELILYDPYDVVDSFINGTTPVTGTGTPQGVTPGQTINPITGRPVGTGGNF